jgi:hypothetical protein
MSAESISQWIQGTGLATAIRGSQYAYPIIISTHLTCIAIFGGLILMTDLRLLGLAMTDVPVATMIRHLRPWKWLGFVIMVTCGILLAISKMSAYYANPYFLAKLSLLALVGVHALVFRPLVYKNPENIDAAPKLPAVARLAGALSLLLWLSIPILGRMIAYYEPPTTSSNAIAAPTLIAAQR